MNACGKGNDYTVGMTSLSDSSTGAGACEPRAASPSPNLGPGSKLQRAAAAFWLGHLFWGARYCTWYPRITRKFWMNAIWFFSPTLRETTLTNARRLAGPDATRAKQRRLARSIIDHFFQFILDLGASSRMTVQQLCQRIGRTIGQEHYNQAVAMGRGVIIATAHLGSFETGMAALVAQGARVHVLFRRDSFANFEAIRARTRQQLGVTEHSVDDGLATWMRLRDALRNEDVVLIQADRAEPGQSGQAVPFMGGHIRLPTGPVRLAQIAGAPIVPVFSYKGHDGLVQIHISKPILVEPSADAAAATSAMPEKGQPHPALLQYACELEKHVSLFPEQWLMLQPLWLEDQQKQELPRA